MWKHRLVTDQQRRLHKREWLKSWWLWLRKPIVLKTAFQTVRLIIELIRLSEGGEATNPVIHI